MIEWGVSFGLGVVGVVGEVDVDGIFEVVVYMGSC